MLHHATRMAAVTMVSRITGYLRDKALAWVLGAGVVNDAFRTAFRIPNAFRALLAEGALHAALVPQLARLGDDDAEGRAARDLVRGVAAALVAVLAVVVGLGVVASPWLVRLYAEGFAADPDKLALTVVMNRLMFPYLALISLAALCQGVLNSRDRFLLPAATPVLFNLVLAAAAWWLAPRTGHAPVVLSAAVLVGGAGQLLVQWPAVRKLGFSLRPAWRLATSEPVRRVGTLMLPGIAVLGLTQLNQLVTSQFASFLGDGAVTAQFYAYRVTELMYGGLIVQLTTVLLPTLSRRLKDDPEDAARVLADTVRLVTFVTLPTVVVLAVAARPVIGLLFGGGRFDPSDVAITAATLSAYSVGLLGTAHAKVMASAFFAHGDTRTPMLCSGLTLMVFTAACALLVGPFGVPGLGAANSIAMTVYAGTLSLALHHRHGIAWWSRTTAGAVGRQLVAATAVGIGILAVRPWLAGVVRTGWTEALEVGAVLGAAVAVYAGLVAVTGGTEPRSTLAAVRRGRSA